MRVWLQLGHVPRRSGVTGTAGEQAYVSRVAGDCAEILDSSGHVIRLAGADERITGRWDLFAALHCDGSTSPSASGASVGYRNTPGKQAARLWKARFEARGWPYGFRADNYTAALARYYGTAWAKAAGIRSSFVLEHGFLTNKRRDARWLTSTEGREASALALADTITMLAGDRPATGVTAPTGDDDMFYCKRGDNGQPVGRVQGRLARLGFYRGKIDLDYGPKTEAAVLAARKAAGSTATSGAVHNHWAENQIGDLLIAAAVEAHPLVEQLAKRSDRQNGRIQTVERMHYPPGTDNATVHPPVPSG